MELLRSQLSDKYYIHQKRRSFDVLSEILFFHDHYFVVTFNLTCIRLIGIEMHLQCKTLVYTDL